MDLWDLWDLLMYFIYLMYLTYQPLLWGGVMYLSTQSLLLDSSLLYSDFQNIQELIYWVILQVIYVDQPQFGLVILFYLYTQPNYRYLQVLDTLPRNNVYIHTQSLTDFSRLQQSLVEFSRSQSSQQNLAEFSQASILLECLF